MAGPNRRVSSPRSSSGWADVRPDDIGAEIGERLRAPRAGEHAREVEQCARRKEAAGGGRRHDEIVV